MAKKSILGREGTDRVTGFTGTIIGISHWLTGCDQIIIKPVELKEGMPQKGQIFDENVVEVGEKIIEPKELKLAKKEKKKGGPNKDAKKLAAEK